MIRAQARVTRVRFGSGQAPRGLSRGRRGPGGAVARRGPGETGAVTGLGGVPGETGAVTGPGGVPGETGAVTGRGGVPGETGAVTGPGGVPGETGAVTGPGGVPGETGAVTGLGGVPGETGAVTGLGGVPERRARSLGSAGAGLSCPAGCSGLAAGRAAGAPRPFPAAACACGEPWVRAARTGRCELGPGQCGLSQLGAGPGCASQPREEKGAGRCRGTASLRKGSPSAWAGVRLQRSCAARRCCPEPGSRRGWGSRSRRVIPVKFGTPGKGFPSVPVSRAAVPCAEALPGQPGSARLGPRSQAGRGRWGLRARHGRERRQSLCTGPGPGLPRGSF
ncbi:collagen, type I, alpha 1b-like [Passer domesticus]|uniref:collagen, type I, alpha 1b-like n=1 Tax=Passer domesticus TaxID=48849 RepID=UPI0030FDFC71